MARRGELRFSGRGEVRSLLHRGLRFRTELGRVVWERSPGVAAARILFVVSTAVSKKSTVRNRIRRELSEAFRRRWRSSPLPAAAIISVDPAVAALPRRRRQALAEDVARRLAALVSRR